MSSTFVQMAGGIGRKVLTATTLGLIGLVVGIGCVLLPPAIPLAIVGVAAALLLWVIPELQTVPFRWARRMVPIVVFVYTSVPIYYAIILPGLPWIQLRRATLLAWLIPMSINLAGSTSARQRIASVLRNSPWLSACTLGFMAVTLITIPTAVYLSLSISYVFNSYINWFIPMFGFILFIRDESRILMIFRVLMVAAAVNFFAGVVEWFLQHPFLIYALPASMRDQIADGNSIAAAKMYTGLGARAGSYRASSTYTTPLSWGEVCAMFIPLALHLAVHSKKPLDRYIGIVGVLMCFFSIVLSGSRGAFVGMIVASVSFSIAWSFRSSLLNKGSLAGKIGLSIYTMASAATLLAVLFVPRVHRAVLGSGEGQLSTQARYDQWALAKPKIIARPVLGWGGGSAGDIIHYPTSWGGFTVDGFYMNLLVDYGVPGFVLFFAAFLLAAGICYRYYLTDRSEAGTLGNALGASIFAFVVYRLTLSQPDSLTIAFMLIGFVFIYASLMENEHASKKASRV